MTNGTVLIIDTDDTNIELLEVMLEEEFDVKALLPTEINDEALKAVNADAVIFNPGDHDIDIEHTCEILKQRNPKAFVVYLDGNVTMDKQTMAFDQGCDDYLAIPFNPIELYHKVKTNLQTLTQTVTLMDQADSARNMAFNMMEANSELGTILRFIQEIITTQCYKDLGIALTDAGDSFDIALSAQLRTHKGTFNFRCDDNSDIAKLLSLATARGQIIENGRRLMLATEHVAFFATKLPEDPQKYGRLKDNLAILLNAAEAKMDSLKVELSLKDERDQLLSNVVSKVSASMMSIQQHYGDHETDIRIISQEFKDHMESVLLAIDLDEKQEEALTESIEAFLNRMMDTEATKHLIQSSFQSLLNDLKKIQ